MSVLSTHIKYIILIADACTTQWNDMKMAMKAKMEPDPNRAEQLLAETHYRKNLGSDLTRSPTAGVIWELKEKPCWDEV
jgi:hypothetical protein